MRRIELPSALRKLLSAPPVIPRSVLIPCLCVIFMVVLSVMVLSVKLVTVMDGDSVKIARMTGDDYSLLLSDLGVSLGEYDELEITESGNRTRLEILRAFPVTLAVDGNSYTRYFIEGSVADLLMKCGVTPRENDILSSPQHAVLTENMEIRLSRVDILEEYIEEIIPHATTRTPSQNIKQGKTVVKASGSDGLMVSLLKNTYVDGVLSASELVSTEVTVEPVTEQLLFGTGGDISTSRGTERFSYYVDMTATAYTYNDGGKWGDVTATGKAVKVGYVAVDPKVIPLGTRLFISYPNGSFCYGYAVAQDTGGAIKGNRIDLFFETRSECREFGRRTVRVYILE